MMQDSHEMKTNSIPRKPDGSRFRANPQKQLIKSLIHDDYKTFEKIVNSGVADINHCYEYPENRTCLEIAVSQNKQKFLSLLLEKKVNVNKQQEFTGAAPIHIAVNCGNSDVIEMLLKDESVNVNIKCKNSITPLLMAVKKIIAAEANQDTKVYENIIKMLLNKDCNVNIPDSYGEGPILLAAKEKLDKVLDIIEKHARGNIDLNTFKDKNHKTARDYLQSNFPEILKRFELKKNINRTEELYINIEKLFNCLENRDEFGFVDIIETLNRNDHLKAIINEIDDENNGSGTMLQIATGKGLEEVVRQLLFFGVKSNDSYPNKHHPIAIACQNGFCNILKMFLDKTSVDPEIGKSLLHDTVQGMYTYNSNNPKSNFKSCLEKLLEHDKISDTINNPDYKNNTPLHYAARNGDNEIVLMLLRNGACVGLRNKLKVPPLADINAKTLETYLNECIHFKKRTLNDGNYEIHIIIKYGFLVPNHSLENSDNTNKNTKYYDSILAPDTDALLFMSKSEELKPLLKHPVINSYIYLKWLSVSILSYANIIFFFLFLVCLMLYIFLGYGIEEKRSDIIKVLNIITYTGVIIGLLLLTIRELFQILILPKQYLKSVENWIEIALIFVTGAIVWYDSFQELIKQQLSAVAILLSLADLILLTGKHPILSTNIVMLRTVSWNFFKYLLSYFILILAFSLSFYTLFRKSVKISQKVPYFNETANDKKESFEDYGSSLFKTIIMLTGELEAGSIKFNSELGRIIFIVFVFMIPIVLYNLLNGLAVSDIQEIRAEAELIDIVSRVEIISYFEGVWIGNMQKAYTKLRSCFLFKKLNNLPKSLFSKRTTKFQEVIIKLNEGNKIEVKMVIKPRPQDYVPNGSEENQNHDVETGECSSNLFQDRSMDEKIVKNAKFIINEKKNEFGEKNGEYEKKLANLENIIITAKNEILESVKRLESTLKNTLQTKKSISGNYLND